MTSEKRAGMPETVPTPAPYPRAAHFADVLKSEFWKLFTLRSTYWCLLAAVGSNLGLAVLLAALLPGALDAQHRASIDVVRLSLGGIHLSQIAFGVLGVLAISGEYRSGMIRTTLAAVPARRLVLTTKAIAFTVTALSVGILSSLAAFFLFQAFLPAGDSMRTSIGDPGVLRAVIGGGLYLTVLGLLGLGLGAILRSSAGSIATLFGLLFVPPLLLQLLPSSWQTTIGPYVPMEAGGQIFVAVHHDPGSLGAWAGFGVFAAYAALALAAGFVLIKRRDA